LDMDFIGNVAFGIVMVIIVSAVMAVPGCVAGGVIVPSDAPLKATPTAATAGVIVPDAPRSSDTPSMSVGPEQNPLPGLLGSTAPMPIWTEPDRPTAKRPALLGDLPSPLRRVLVAGAVAVLVAAIALTVAFWPSTTPPGSTTPASGAGAVPTGGSATGGTSAAPTGAGSRAKPGEKPTYATLVIRVDAPASITVDGQAQPMGDHATVNVQPGVEHIVTVQRPGHSMRKLHVPSLAPGESMPLKFSVR